MTLRQFIDKKGFLDIFSGEYYDFPSENFPVSRWLCICDIMEDITNGIAFIHSHNEVHRDLKPPNGMSFVSLG
jgi:serine/threonine protein kinase